MGWTRYLDTIDVGKLDRLAYDYDLGVDEVLRAVQGVGINKSHLERERRMRASGLTCQCAAANFDPCPIHERAPDASD